MLLASQAGRIFGIASGLAVMFLRVVVFSFSLFVSCQIISDIEEVWRTRGL